MKPITAAVVLATLRAAHPRGKFPPLAQWTGPLTRLAVIVTRVRGMKIVGPNRRDVKGLRAARKMVDDHRLAMAPELRPYDDPAWTEIECLANGLLDRLGRPPTRSRAQYYKARLLRDALTEALQAIGMDVAFTSRDGPGIEMLVALLHLAGVKEATVEGIEKMFERERKRARVISRHYVTDK